MSYKYKCTGTKVNNELCDFESDDQLSVEMCEKRHDCTRKDHPQTGLVFDFKITQTKCNCSKETMDIHKELPFEKQMEFNSKLTALAMEYYAV